MVPDKISNAEISEKDILCLLRETFLKEFDRLLYMAMSHLKNQEDAEDILHDLYIDLWNYRDSLAKVKNIDAYIFTALKYKIFKSLDCRKFDFPLIEDVLEGDLIKDEDDETAMLSLDNVYDQMEVNIESLPDKCKLIFQKRYKEGYSASEVASQLCIAISTVNNQSSKAVHILRNSLKNYAPAVFFVCLNDCWFL
jgi:RNA polymerase sigma factor (sigma-70 family)